MASRTYNQGVATLGFPNGGPSVVLRLNPNAISWNFQIDTSVTETVGGRVVQVLGATLSDLAIRGSFGEIRGTSHTESRVLAEKFLAKMKEMAAWQARDINKRERMHDPAVFAFPTKGWKFAVYIKDLRDPDGGGSVTHRPGKFAYDYELLLMVQEDMSDTAQILGKSNGVLANKANKAVQSYMERIADGIGWTRSQYNGGTPTGTTISEATGHGSANAAEAPKPPASTGTHTTGQKAAER